MTLEKNLTPPQVFDYDCYRKFLGDYYLYKKKSNPTFSYRVFSRLAGFKSPNILKLVIEGTRNITFKSMDQYTLALGFDKEQKHHFSLLVRLKRSKKKEEQDQIRAELSRYQQIHRKVLGKGEEAEYLSHWLYPVIDELTKNPNFEDNAEWVQSQLVDSPSLTDIDAALAFLKKFQFIEKKIDGTFVSSTRLIASSSGEKNLQIRRYHRKILNQSANMLELLPIDERMFRALTLSVRSEAFAELKEILLQFKEDLLSWYIGQEEIQKDLPEDRQRQTIVQLNIQLYKQSK